MKKKIICLILVAFSIFASITFKVSATHNFEIFSECKKVFTSSNSCGAFCYGYNDNNLYSAILSPTKKTHKTTDEKVLIIIPKPRNVVGDTETVVSVNGEMYQIMYDRPVEVPRNVAEIIAQSRELEMKIAQITEGAVLKPGKAALAEL